MDTLETIRVQRDGPRGFHIINKSSFDPALHVPCDENGVALASPSDAEQIDIVADWRTLHHNAKIALAERINGDDALVPIDGETKTAAAERVIEAEVARRAVE